MTRRLVITIAVVAGACAAGVLAAGAPPGQARAETPACASYPRPGTRASGQAPAHLRAQYGVLRRARGPGDRTALARLGPLPGSQILAGSLRHLGAVAEGGQVYLVAARHLLSSPLEPPRCVAPGQRALQRALLPGLRREYAHPALCLVIVYAVRSSPTCQAAPGTVAPMLIASGAPGLGLVPDGVPAVRLGFRHGPGRRVPVHGNFWRLPGSENTPVPCGLEWLDGQGIVLRTVTSCNAGHDST